MNSDKVLISVIVPVFNQWELVPDLLACLKAQTISQASFEVVLVDNGSDRVPAADGEPAFVRRLACAVPGSYAARNYGAARAVGECLVFTDADCLPAPDWLEAIDQCRSRNDSSRILVAGSVEVFATEPLTLAARYDMALGFPQQHYVSRGYGVTANLAVPRELFRRAGAFDANRLSGGDADFCWRAARQGATVVYCAGARVKHPARRSMAELIRKVRRLKGGQLCNGPVSRRMQFAVRGFIPPVRAWWRIWRSPRLGFVERMAVSLVQGRLWLAEMAETFRLLAGRAAERR